MLFIHLAHFSTLQCGLGNINLSPPSLVGSGTMYLSYIAPMSMFSPLLVSVHYSEDSDRLKVTNVHFWRHVNYDNYHPMLRVWVPGTKILSRL